MKQPPLLLVTLILLVFGAGCTDSAEVNASENTTPAPALYYEQGTTSIALNLSEITVDDPGNLAANVTMVLETLLADQRTAILLENGWNITSVRMASDEDDPNRAYAEVEFRHDGLSFFIGVDETARRTLEGRCGAEWWLSTPVSGPLPEGYHQATDKSTKTYHVFDERNKRVAMIYNHTTIFYLYPSYSIINMEGILG
ncbi:hypothetical protein [Methanoculleus sp. 7T]|uniref:hypothetical protein n=1 Tax=Methanoculleus sp. 7T TaxID=2937282 RepID=UPI0020C02F62|nr:hypothetical protein [Methanoculleus sp. 7T]MCK8518435.1 hypothetical protein [Methanoculleus sp. 7T]